MSDSRSTRPSLLLRIRDAGDSASWEDFASVYGPIIRGYCRRKGLQEADAADIEQEVLAQVSRSIGGFEYVPTRGRFRDWLGTVTRNKIARHFASKGRGGPAVAWEEAEAQLEDVGEDAEWSAEYYTRILKAALARIRDDFEDRTWSAFERIWFEDSPAPDVAKELGMTIDSIYAAKSRILRRLRVEVLAIADDLPDIFPKP